MPRRIFLLFLILLACRPAWADGAIHLILSEAGAAHQEAAEAFRAALDTTRPVTLWPAAEVTPDLVRSLTRGQDLIVPVGVRAAHLAVEHHAGQASILALMIPRAAGEGLAWPAGPGRRKTSYVYIDPPVSRSLDLVSQAFPKADRVGAVISPENAGVARILAQGAARRKLGLALESVSAPEELAPALRRVLQESDVYLLVPDALAINAANVQNVLLTTYRHRVPVVGFSQGLAKAGTVVSLYSSPAQIGRQGARFARRWLETGDLPAPQPAAEFSLAFNRRVARSLGVILPDEDALRHRLGIAE